MAVQAARALDDLAEMFVRRVQHIHNAAKLGLDRDRAATVERSDGLVNRRAGTIVAKGIYMCGPSGMTASFQRSLRKLGVPRMHIHFEHFDLR